MNRIDWPRAAALALMAASAAVTILGLSYDAPAPQGADLQNTNRRQR